MFSSKEQRFWIFFTNQDSGCSIGSSACGVGREGRARAYHVARCHAGYVGPRHDLAISVVPCSSLNVLCTAEIFMSVLLLTGGLGGGRGPPPTWFKINRPSTVFSLTGQFQGLPLSLSLFTRSGNSTREVNIPTKEKKKKKEFE